MLTDIETERENVRSRISDSGLQYEAREWLEDDLFWIWQSDELRTGSILRPHPTVATLQSKRRRHLRNRSNLGGFLCVAPPISPSVQENFRGP